MAHLLLSVKNIATLMYYLLMMFNFWQIKNEFTKPVTG